MGRMEKILPGGNEAGPLPIGEDWSEVRSICTSLSRQINTQIAGILNGRNLNRSALCVNWSRTVGPAVYAESYPHFSHRELKRGSMSVCRCHFVLFLLALLLGICLGILFPFVSDPFSFFTILSWIHSFVHCPTFSQRIAVLTARTTIYDW
jgi:hypothetical protein